MFAFGCRHPAKNKAYHKAESMADVQNIMKNLQTGDVLMFFLSGIPACLARGSLYSHWDHIGIVIRRKGYSRELIKGQELPEEQKKSSRPCKPTYCTCQSKNKDDEHVELLEATASGIHVYSLEERIARARSHYKVIAIRKLRGFKNSVETQARLEALIEKVRGRGYQFMNKRVFMMGYHGGVPNEEKVKRVAELKRRISDHIKRTSMINKRLSNRMTRAGSRSIFDGELFIPERVMCSELASAALIHLHVIEPGIFEVDDIGPNTYSTIDSRDMLNQIVRKGLKYDPEYIFHYPGGPYERALDALTKVMVENKTLVERDHTDVLQKTSTFIRNVSKISPWAPKSVVAPEKIEAQKKDPKHFTSLEAMQKLALNTPKRKSRLASVIHKISNRITSFFTVEDDWDVVVASCSDADEDTSMSNADEEEEEEKFSD